MNNSIYILLKQIFKEVYYVCILIFRYPSNAYYTFLYLPGAVHICEKTK